MNSASHSTSSLSHKSQCVIVDNTSELTRAEKLKLWQSMKSTSSSSLSSSYPNGNGQKKDFASSSTVTVPSTFKLSNRKNNPNGTVKSILFKKKNYKKYRNSFHENTILEQYSPQSQPEKPDSKAPRLSQTENDEENNCPNETPDDQSTKLVTPLKKKKVLSTHSSQPSPYLDGYLTANDESSSQPASPTPPSPTPPVPSSASASSFFMTKTLEKLQQDNLHLKAQLRRSTEIQNESVAIAKMSQQEIECLNFANDILTQKCNEIEEQLTRERMRYHEKDNHRIDKYREEIKSLKAKNSEYERRANEMVTEMNQQMSQLQDMAMTRIEVRYNTVLSFSLHSDISPPRSPFSPLPHLVSVWCSLLRKSFSLSNTRVKLYRIPFKSSLFRMSQKTNMFAGELTLSSPPPLPAPPPRSSPLSL
jgi:hypothetical protein